MNKNLVIPNGPASLQTSSTSSTSSNPSNPSNPSKCEEIISNKLTSTIQLSRPFLTKDQITYAQQRTIENITVYYQRRNQIFQFLYKICVTLKFPIRILEISMIYYQRYFLHNKFDTMIYYDIALTSLFIASKNEDTIKKLRDIIIAGNQIKNNLMNIEQIELFKKKILRFEFKLLETISFDFRVYHIEEFLIKIGKEIKIKKDIIYLGWLISIDSFQTSISLKVPSHTIAIGCLILALKLKGINKFKINFNKYHTSENSVNESLLDLLDLYINSYNYTNLVNFFPDLKNKFIDIKLNFNEIKGLKDQTFNNILKDEYFKDRNFSNGERRYMLGFQKKRLYNEISN